MEDIYKNTEEYNPTRNSKTLIVFYDVNADMVNNKNLTQL